MRLPRRPDRPWANLSASRSEDSRSCAARSAPLVQRFRAARLSVTTGLSQLQDMLVVALEGRRLQEFAVDFHRRADVLVAEELLDGPEVARMGFEMQLGRDVPKEVR